MKKLKFLPFMVMMMLASFTFVSCSDDDDDDLDKKDDKEIAAEIVGEWKRVSKEGWYKENGKIEDEFKDTYTEDFKHYKFNSNGTGMEFWSEDLDSDGNPYGYDITWSIKDKKLTIIDDGDIEDPRTIIELTSSTLVWEEYYKGSNSSYDYEDYTKTTLTKVK